MGRLIAHLADVDAVDPALLSPKKNHQGLGLGIRAFDIPLFGPGGPTADDVKQGALDNCSFASAVAAIAQRNPAAIHQCIRPSAQPGQFVVRLLTDNRGTTPLVAREFVVDNRLYVRADGTPWYGSSPGMSSLWFALIEKAHCMLCSELDSPTTNNAPSYDGSIGHCSAETAILGQKESLAVDRGQSPHPSDDDAGRAEIARRCDETWLALKPAIDKGSVVTATSGIAGSGTWQYTNTGLVGWHSYTVLDVVERNGQRMVELRNPWGKGELFPGDGKEDGRFAISLEQFVRWFPLAFAAESAMSAAAIAADRDPVQK